DDTLSVEARQYPKYTVRAGMLRTHVHEQLFGAQTGSNLSAAIFRERGHDVFAQDTIPLMSTPKRRAPSLVARVQDKPTDPLTGAPYPILFELALPYGAPILVIFAQ